MPINKTFSITLYDYHELGEVAQKVAYDNFCQRLDKNAVAIEVLQKILIEKGYPVGDIRCYVNSGSLDGVAFYGRLGYDNLRILLARLTPFDESDLDSFAEHLYELIIEIRKHPYLHDNCATMYVNCFHEDFLTFDDGEFIEALERDIIETSVELKKTARAAIEYERSLPRFLEIVVLHGWKFYANGDLFILASDSI